MTGFIAYCLNNSDTITASRVNYYENGQISGFEELKVISDDTLHGKGSYLYFKGGNKKSYKYISDFEEIYEDYNKNGQILRKIHKMPQRRYVYESKYFYSDDRLDEVRFYDRNGSAGYKKYIYEDGKISIERFFNEKIVFIISYFMSMNIGNLGSVSKVMYPETSGQQLKTVHILSL